MPTNDDVVLTLMVSTRLGVYGASLLTMEPAIDAAIKIVTDQKEEDPDNRVIPLMMNLLIAAKDLIAAHKLIEKVATMIISGSLPVDGPESVQ